MSAKNRLGIILIIIGAVLLANQFGVLPGEITLLIMASVFGVGYVYMGKENYYSLGMIIPASMFLSIYLYTILENVKYVAFFEGSLFFMLVALGFFGVWLVHTRRFGKGGRANWPLIVSASTGGFSIFILTVELLSSEAARDRAGIIAPAILIAFGIILVLVSIFRRK